MWRLAGRCRQSQGLCRAQQLSLCMILPSPYCSEQQCSWLLAPATTLRLLLVRYITIRRQGLRRHPKWCSGGWEGGCGRRRGGMWQPPQSLQFQRFMQSGWCSEAHIKFMQRLAHLEWQRKKCCCHAGGRQPHPSSRKRNHVAGRRAMSKDTMQGAGRLAELPHQQSSTCALQQ